MRGLAIFQIYLIVDLLYILFTLVVAILTLVGVSVVGGVAVSQADPNQQAALGGAVAGGVIVSGVLWLIIFREYILESKNI